ncbi:Putative site-specific recombinase [Moritella viscosa]|uniref:recombinase family protein n=1 Tax=Moritella viscosa TaxID=80854 RepID=UPI0009177051|nr:recombinase family protein [Moritella viscosa]SHO19437.1 Putative site-specific recombinase [Moritella viscosa]
MTVSAVKINKQSSNQIINVYGYLRASTKEQNADRARVTLEVFARQQGFAIKDFATENQSGTKLERPELMRLLRTAQKGDCILVEQIDRLTRLHPADWFLLKRELEDKGIRIVSIDCPTSFAFLTPNKALDVVMNAINGMMIDILATFAHKDNEDRRRRQAEGIMIAKAEGKYKGRVQSTKTVDRCKRAIELINSSKMTKEEASKAVGLGVATLYRYIKESKQLG